MTVGENPSARKACAMASAVWTERCLPPVQPNAIGDVSLALLGIAREEHQHEVADPRECLAPCRVALDMGGDRRVEAR